MNSAASRPARYSRRQPRPSRRGVRAAAVRRRGAPRPAPWLTAGQVDTWLLQGLICAAMLGMLVWFRAPLAAALKGMF